VVQFEEAHQVTHTFEGQYIEVSPVVSPMLALSTRCRRELSALENEGYEDYIGGRVISAFALIVVFGFYLLVRLADARHRRQAIADAGAFETPKLAQLP
jgi:hypothetical protein